MNSPHVWWAALIALAGLQLGCAETTSRPAMPWGGPAPRVADMGPPPPAPGEAYNKDARADHLVGGIAAQVGNALKLEEQARIDREGNKLSCIHSALESLRGIETQAHEQRSAMRAAEDDDAAAGPFSALSGLDAQARNVRTTASQCQEGARPPAPYAYERTGSSNSDNDADGIPDVVDTPGPYRADASKARQSLLGDTVLAGVATDFRRVATGGAAPSTPPVQSPQPPAATRAATTAQRQAMLIRTAEISLAVYEVDKNLNAVEKAANDMGGYLALRSDRQITVRVPAERFDELVAKIEKMGDVLHKNIAAEDVSDQFVDVDMRLRNATAVRDRLEKLLIGATVKDAVDIHRELAKITEEIERLEGKLKLLKDRIAYSSISVSFEPTQAQSVRSQALLPFSWMSTMGLQPLLTVPRETK